MAHQFAEILNANYDYVHQALPEVKKAFDGLPGKTLLSAGETLYRFVYSSSDGALEGFWWPVESYHRLRQSEWDSGDLMPEWVWSRSAAAANLPSGTRLICMATLVQQVYGFRGRTQLPAGAKTPAGWSPATCARVWIPGLSAEHVWVRCFSL